jgi:methionyl-tRNA formyltransferase
LGSYFGGRRPEDGIIDWKRDALSIHNLVRAVAPPYPGARTTLAGMPARVLRTRLFDRATSPTSSPAIETHDGKLLVRCGGGGTLAVLSLELAGAACDAAALVARFGAWPVPLGTTAGNGCGHV